jgi:hypothetical protein
MAAAPRLPDFDPPAAPMSAKFTKVLDVGLCPLVATPLGRVVVNATVSIVMAIAASRPVRFDNGAWPGLLFFALFFVIREVISQPVTKLVTTRWFQTLWVGKPCFDPLKGPHKQQFRFILRCFASLELFLPSEMEKLCQRVGKYSAHQLEENYRRSYEDGGFDRRDWPRVWDKIQQTKYFGVTYGEAVRSGRWELFLFKYDRVTKLVFPLAALYAVGVVWLLGDVVQGKSLLRLVQFALAGGLIISFVVFINFTASFRILKVPSKDESQELRRQMLRESAAVPSASQADEKALPMSRELQAAVERYAGVEYYPEISIKAGYVEAVRNRFIRDLLALEFVIVAQFIIILIVQWPVAHALSHWTDSQVNAWTERMLIGSVLAPAVLGIALALGFIILSRFKKFVGILATGILLAIVPPLISYALHGSAGNVVLISSIVAAAIGVLPGAVAEIIKQEPGIKMPDAEARASSDGALGHADASCA